jgi:hypothetical protein
VQERVRAVELERFRPIQIAAKAAREALDAEGALQVGKGATRDVAVASDEQLFHELILTSCTTSP